MCENHGVLRSWVMPLNGEVADRIKLDVERVVTRGVFRAGPFVARLEDRLAEDFAGPAVAVGSGMDGIELLLESMNVAGRRVLVPANCFQSIPAMVARSGGSPVPVPVDEVHLSPVTAGLSLADRPVIFWVHHLGMVAPDASERIAALRAAGCMVIEDCAYVTFGSGDRIGRWGDAAVLTFGPTKPNAGSGGGAVVVRDPSLAAEVASRRDHGGQEPFWQAGGSVLRYRSMPEMEAVVAFHQWCARDERRAALVRTSAAYLAALDRGYVPDGRSVQPSWGRLLVDVGGRDGEAVRLHLAAVHGIVTTCMYERPWFDYPALRAVAEMASVEGWDSLRALLRRSICVPFHPAMTGEDVARVCAALGPFDVCGTG